MTEKNELLNMYLGAATILGEGKTPTDLKVIGEELSGISHFRLTKWRVFYTVYCV